jgi:hypothetical protein
MQCQLLINVDVLVKIDWNGMLIHWLVEIFDYSTPMDHYLKSKAFGVILVKAQILIKSEYDSRHIV